MSYRKGRRFEYRVKKFLEERGFVVFRIAGSKPVDLIAINGTFNIVMIIECKNMKMSNSRLEVELELLQKKINIPPKKVTYAVFYNEKGKIKVYPRYILHMLKALMEE